MFGALACILAGLIVCVNGSIAQAEELRGGSLQWYAAKAKAKGKDRRGIPPPVVVSVELTELEPAFREYMIVAAVPIAKTISSEGVIINTSYKLQIQERIKTHPQLDEPDRVNPPKNFLPIKDNEIVISMLGGSIDLDGVHLTMPYTPIKELMLQDRYLFLIIPCASGKTGFLNAGENSVFKLSPSGGITSHSSAERISIFQEGLMSRTGARLDLLKRLVTQLP